MADPNSIFDLNAIMDEVQADLNQYKIEHPDCTEEDFDIDMWNRAFPDHPVSTRKATKATESGVAAADGHHSQKETAVNAPSDQEDPECESGTTTISTHEASSDEEVKEEPTDESLPACANCKAPAKIPCDACSDIPVLPRRNLKRTHYCSKVCQEIDKPAHESTCKSVQSRLNGFRLYRAALFIQSAFLHWREAAFDHSISNVSIEGRGILEAEEGCNDSNYILPGYPDEIANTLSPYHQRVLVTMMACSDVFIGMQNVLAAFLKDSVLQAKISEIDHAVKHTHRTFSFFRVNLTQADSKNFSHCVHHIKLKDGSEWCLDLTGAQFGHRTPLTEWDEYQAQRVRYIKDKSKFGKTYRTIVPKGGPKTRRDAQSKKEFKVKLELSKIFEDAILAGFEQEGVTVDQLLSDVPFKEFEKVSWGVLARAKKELQESTVFKEKVGDGKVTAVWAN